MSSSPVFITKADGTQEAFDSAKLRRSLKRANAKPGDIDYIVSHVEQELQSGDETSKIYRHAFAILKKRERATAARYSLKRAITDLGPSGFAFEIFLSELFRAQGYTTEVGLIMKGECVEYEIDLLAEKEGEVFIGEAKFHSNHGIKSDLKVALYVHARYEDLKKAYFGGRLDPEERCTCALITNTKFTKNAINYGKCVGLHMIGWSYPKKGNLQELIETAHLEPLTALTTLNKREKTDLLNEGLVLCRSLAGNRAALRAVGVSEERVRVVEEEVRELCGI